ncbi:MAG: hypothetical protein ACR2PY_00765, partial [Salinispira sp.]
ETKEEVLGLMDDLIGCGVSMMNMGQYLQPSRNHLPVRKYWRPEEFTDLREHALEKGFAFVEAGPLVRSSYHAGAQYAALKENRNRQNSAENIAHTEVLRRIQEYQQRTS